LAVTQVGHAGLQARAAAKTSALSTLAQVAISALEMVHYAHPPTGTIQTLPGKLVITQSQAAHCEIADLLMQLQDE
jgi:hypothetical protein